MLLRGGLVLEQFRFENFVTEALEEGTMATTVTSYDVISIGERAAEGEDDRVYVRLRADLDIGAFGATASFQKKTGEPVITEHDEVGPASDGHEELYVVVQGRATFTVDDDEIDAPQGTVVPSATRPRSERSLAGTDGTIVSPSAAGAARPTVSAPGLRFASSSACTARRTTKAR